MFTNQNLSSKQKELIEKLLNNEEKIKKGIEKIELNNEEEKVLEKIDEKEINYMELLKHIIPLICLLTIHDKETSFIEMFKFIESNEYIYNILIDQTKSWWGKSIDSKIIKNFINVYIKYMKNDKETNQIIITVKELFVKNIKNNKELSNLIDKYLIPQELEKKTNAEVSTPVKLRMEMLDKIPKEFWEKPQKVFEPCSGKGGFLIDIIDRFMNGLERSIIDMKERYKIIVENCLYFSDINPTNIFICKLLIDPYNEYKLNYNEGNTLELDFKEKWSIDTFDAIIGNPPYESQYGTGDNKLYLDFTKFSIDILTKNGILLFITPTTIIDYIIEMDKNRNYLDKFYNIEYIALNTPEKYFKVSSTFTYFILKKQKYKGSTIIEHNKGKDIIVLKKGMKLPKIPSKKDLIILEKICSNDNCYDIKKCKFSNKTQRIRKDHIKKNIVSNDKTDIYKYKIYDTINKTNQNGKYYYYDKLDNDAGKKRIILSNKGYLLPYSTRIKKFGSDTESTY